MKKRVIVLGVSGSIGRNCLDVLRAHPDKFELAGAQAHSDSRFLASLAAEFPGCVPCLSVEAGTHDVADLSRDGALPAKTLRGSAGLRALIRDTAADIVVNGIAGAAGLISSVDSLESGKDLALANKETMVIAGRLVKSVAAKHGKKILPVDSEHSAIFCLIEAHGAGKVDEIILTASGGPFRDLPPERFASITVAEALAHPSWSMGRKISVDSATMANKGLEVMEAVELFDMEPERVKVLIHRESMVHSLVRLGNGELYAQISAPDMRQPIQNALTWPGMAACPFGHLDLAGKSLSFSPPDRARFPLLALAETCAEKAGRYPLAYNAANEIAVAAFLDGRIAFTAIASLVDRVLQEDHSGNADSLESILAHDRRVRERSSELLEEFPCPSC